MDVPFLISFLFTLVLYQDSVVRSHIFSKDFRNPWRYLLRTSLVREPQTYGAAAKENNEKEVVSRSLRTTSRYVKERAKVEGLKVNLECSCVKRGNF